MKVNDLRKLFLQYFEQNGHKIIESAPLVPINDPSLLWINAGIAPLKKFFDGSVVPEHKRLVNCQKCIRTNDIENVGVTARHHTFFEMLGNFSIGDYFKEEAIEFAFEFLTGEEWLNFDLDKLYMTYYPSDEKSKETWMKLGVEESHLVPLDGNYWEIGEGPCGPCSEIFYDRGEKYDSRGIEILYDDLDNDRYVEIWNIVFSQFNGSESLDRSDYPELPNKNIDTGMGLERVACILQDVETNFEIDSFMILMHKISSLSNIEYTGQMAFKIIADHIRTACLAIADSALPSNEGRGYVIRRLLRRAVRYGVKLGFNEPFMYKLVQDVNQSLPCYDFTSQIEMVETIIKNEEQKFYNTLESGEKKLAEVMKNGAVSGEEAFVLYDTFGFPIELTVEIAEESNIKVDLDAFNKCLEEQRDRSRISRNDESGLNKQSEALLKLPQDSEFIGYDVLESNSKVVAVIKDDELVESASGEIGLVFDKTPFYAESGGQVSDEGLIADCEVTEVFKAPLGQHVHYINTSSMIAVGDNVLCAVDKAFRDDVTKNHSSTHLLNYALKQVYGNHIKQQGSYVSNDYLRFDFAHFDSVDDSTIVEVEKLINDYLNSWSKIEIKTMAIDEAKAIGAAALFGEKYGDVVRVVTLGDSLELCGGCHIDSFDSIKKFAIVSYESKGSGVYRIVATTNENISPMLKSDSAVIVEDIKKVVEKTREVASDFDLTQLNNAFNDFETIYSNLESYEEKVKLALVKDEILNIKKSLDKELKEKQANEAISSLDFSNEIEEISNLKVVISKVEDLDVEATKAVLDDQFEKHGLDVMVIVNTHGSVVFIAKASDNAISSGIKCGDLVKQAAIVCGGNGGGRPNFAQAGGKDKTKVDEAITVIKDLISGL